MFRLLLVFCAMIFCALDALAQDFCEDEKFKRAHVGYSFVDVETGKEVLAKNGEQFFIPASLMKIPMSAAALFVLGEEHRFVTELVYTGEIDKEGHLRGNVWIRGGGDPTFSLAKIEEWGKEMKMRGICKIEGKILVDDSCFEAALASPFWYFEDLGNYYGAGASSLSVNQNLYRITFKPGEKEGDPATVVATDPPMPDLFVRNEVRTGPQGSGDRVNIFGMEYSPIQFYRGTVPVDQETMTVKASMPNPPLFCATSLKREIEAAQGVGIEKAPAKSTLLCRAESPPLRTIIEEMNLYSINLYAEHLLKTIGGGIAKKGALALEKYLKEQQIPCQVRDGSGLARSNLLTPRGFTRLLREIRNNPLYKSVSFPEPGKKGSLSQFPELHGAAMRAKTGFMTNVCNLGGFLILPSGKEFAFSLFCNNNEGTRAEILEEMHRFLNFALKDYLLDLNK